MSFIYSAQGDSDSVRRFLGKDLGRSVQCDGTNITTFIERAGGQRPGCWSHARRRFVEAAAEWAILLPFRALGRRRLDPQHDAHRPGLRGRYVNGMWGVASRAAWAVGADYSTSAANGTTDLWRYDGVAWQVLDNVSGGLTTKFLGNLGLVSGSGASNVWALAPAGVWHNDGAAWSVLIPTGGFSFYQVAAAGPNEVGLPGAM